MCRQNSGSYIFFIRISPLLANSVYKGLLCYKLLKERRLCLIQLLFLLILIRSGSILHVLLVVSHRLIIHIRVHCEERVLREIRRWFSFSTDNVRFVLEATLVSFDIWLNLSHVSVSSRSQLLLPLFKVLSGPHYHLEVRRYFQSAAYLWFLLHQRLVVLGWVRVSFFKLRLSYVGNVFQNLWIVCVLSL